MATEQQVAGALRYIRRPPMEASLTQIHSDNGNPQLVRGGDSDVMTRAIMWCAINQVPLTRCGANQLKVGKLNFWPDTGTITMDGGYRHIHNGIDAFVELISSTSWFKEARAANREQAYDPGPDELAASD